MVRVLLRIANRPAAGHQCVMHVLILEDEPDQAECLAMLLSEVGYSTDFACVASRAIESAVSRRPDLVLADVRLRGENTRDCLRRLLAELGPIPIILVSGLPPDHGEVSAAIDDFQCAFVPKPIDLRDLLSLMSTCWISADAQSNSHPRATLDSK